MYGDLTPIVTDPRVDPPSRACFNCWEFGHPFVRCPRPQKALYCRNCGRRHVDTKTCPRCCVAHEAHLQKLEQQREDRYKEIGREVMMQQREQRYREAARRFSVYDRPSIAGPSTSAPRYESSGDEGARRHESRKRTRDASSQPRRDPTPRRSSRGSSVVSSSPQREVSGVRHETYGILRETRRMSDQVRERLMKAVLQECLEEDESKRKRR